MTSQNPFELLLKEPLLLGNLIHKMGFKEPSPIQSAVIPDILAGKDVCAGAKTGSGKTIAFLAPTAERILRKEIKRAIVLSPTRELVLQMDEEAMRLLDGQTDLVSIPLYGGVPTDPQILALKHHNPKILIATPGRIIDLLQEGCLPISEIETIILDEADRMCDMGFAPQVNQILDALVAKKQMLMFSATLPKELNDIMQRFCNDPVRIQVDAADESSNTIRHIAAYCGRSEKFKRLGEIFEDAESTSIIFTRTRKKADEIYADFSRQRKDVGILHAGFSMPERERTIRSFREGRIQHLIATDVVSRGIDIDRVTHVIQWDLPETLEEYIHRSGRAGRAGRTGTSIVFIDTRTRDQAELLEAFAKKIPFEIEGKAGSGSNHARMDEQRSGEKRSGERSGRHPREQRHRDGHSNARPQRRHGPERHSDHRKKSDRPASPAKQAPAKKTSSGLLSKTKSLIKKIFGSSKKR